jgi:hypothetical protein
MVVRILSCFFILSFYFELYCLFSFVRSFSKSRRLLPDRKEAPAILLYKLFRKG